MTKLLLNSREAAEVIGRSEQQMRWMRHKGIGPKSAKVGGRVMYRYSDIIDWINAAFEVGEEK